VREWHDIGSRDQVERDGRVILRVGGREIGVLVDPSDGRVKALRNRCPHVGSPLCRGSVRTREKGGAPGLYALEDGKVLRCPHHGWEFDLDSGVCLDDPAMRVAVYEVREVDGRVHVLA
jgi:3-phenylpropionate/trans-cinnamate dioxygenase ferredoxin subunit